MKDLHGTCIREYLPKFIAKFLKTEKFKLKLQNYTSATHLQKNRVPQDSVLAVTLFAIKINSLAAIILNLPSIHELTLCGRFAGGNGTCKAIYLERIYTSGPKKMDLDFHKQKPKSCTLQLCLAST